MKIASLNKLESRVNFQDEIKSMYVNTILAEHNFIASIISHEILVYTERGILNVKSLINQFHKYMPNRTQFLESLKTVENHEKIYQKLSKTKYHDKRTLEFINRHKNNVSILNKRFGDYLEERLKHFKIWELIEFKKEPDWELVLPLYEYDQTHESIYIQAMEQAVPSCEYILSFDNVVEQLFSWSDFDQAEANVVEYIKIPLWDFPMIEDMTFNQLKYTRADLKLMLEQFYIQFYDCLRQLFAMPFSIENHEKIVVIVQDKILSLKQSIQQAIDTSLYISQLRNKTQGNSGLTFNLGIASAETLVDYYQRTEMIESYVASEIKDRLKRTMNLDATCVFS